MADSGTGEAIRRRSDGYDGWRVAVGFAVLLALLRPRSKNQDIVRAMPLNVRIAIFRSGPLSPKTQILRTPCGGFRKFLWRFAQAHDLASCSPTEKSPA
jgi:hypothetical protein